MTAKSNGIINNLQEFLDWRGCGDDPYQWARAFYKYGIGAWVSFLTKKTEAYNRCATMAIGLVNGKLQVVHRVEEMDERDNVNEDDLQFFGFDKDGRRESGICRTLKGYRQQIQDFIDKHPDGAPTTGGGVTTYRPVVLHAGHYMSGEPDPRRIWVTIREHVPATLNDVYYEDLRQKNPPAVNIHNCVGLKIGSIVEGSDVNVGPYEFLFPFQRSEFDRAEQDLTDEVNFYWERDNSQWYELRVGDDRTFYLHNTWGEIKWDCRKPHWTVVRKVEAFLHSDEALNGIPTMPHAYQASKPDWKPAPVPGLKNTTIHEYINDTTF